MEQMMVKASCVLSRIRKERARLHGAVHDAELTLDNFVLHSAKEEVALRTALGENVTVESLGLPERPAGVTRRWQEEHRDRPATVAVHGKVRYEAIATPCTPQIQPEGLSPEAHLAYEWRGLPQTCGRVGDKTIWWRPQRPTEESGYERSCSRPFNAAILAQCLLALPHRRVVLAGDSTMIQVITALRVWFGHVEDRYEFEIEEAPEEEGEEGAAVGETLGLEPEVEGHGEHDQEIVVTDRHTGQRGLLSFRFHRGLYSPKQRGPDGHRLAPFPRRLQTMIDKSRFQSLALADGWTRWDPQREVEPVTDLDRLRAGVPDAFVFYMGSGLRRGAWSAQDHPKAVPPAAVAELRAGLRMVARARVPRILYVTESSIRGHATISGETIARHVQHQRRELRELVKPNDPGFALLDWYNLSKALGNRDYQEDGHRMETGAVAVLIDAIFSEVCNGVSGLDAAGAT